MATKKTGSVAQAEETPVVIRQIHEFIPSRADPQTGRDLPEKLETHTEWNDHLESKAQSTGKISVNCLEWILGPSGEKVLSACVQIPYRDARRWFKLGLSMYDTSGITNVVTRGKKEQEKSDAILRKLDEQSQLNTELLKVLTKILSKEGE